MMEVVRAWRQRSSPAPQVDFLATSGDPGVFDEEAKSLGCRIHYVRYGRLQLPRFRRDFRRVLAAGGYDAIHDHQGYVGGWHFLMGAGMLPPVRVTHVHNPTTELENLDWSRSLSVDIGKWLVARFATHIAGTSLQLIEEYGFAEPAFAHLPRAALHCGFDPVRFCGDPAAQKASLAAELGWPAGSKTILFAGRIDGSPEFDHPRNHKNSGFAVAVAIACAERDPRVRMVLAGAESAAVAALKARIAAAGLTDRIRFLGVRHDMGRLMLGSDALLFPSRTEGLGMVAVEAQAASLPVLAATGVPRECVVVDDLVEFLELSAGPDAWAERLLKLMDKPRDVAGSNAAVRASAFSVDRSIAALERLYRDRVLQNRIVPAAA